MRGIAFLNSHGSLGPKRGLRTLRNKRVSMFLCSETFFSRGNIYRMPPLRIARCRTGPTGTRGPDSRVAAQHPRDGIRDQLSSFFLRETTTAADPLL